MNPSECRAINLIALKRYLKDARKELAKGNFKALEVLLAQAYGRAKNLNQIGDLEDAL